MGHFSFHTQINMSAPELSDVTLALVDANVLLAGRQGQTWARVFPKYEFKAIDFFRGRIPFKGKLTKSEWHSYYSAFPGHDRPWPMSRKTLCPWAYCLKRYMWRRRTNLSHGPHGAARKNLHQRVEFLYNIPNQWLLSSVHTIDAS